MLDFSKQQAAADTLAGNSYQKGKAYFDALFAAGRIPNCSPGYISGACDGGDRFAAPYLCGKETCKDCGIDGSPIHARRVQRWRPLVEGFSSLGYLVLTFPVEVRYLLKDACVLADFRYNLRRKLQRMGIEKGLARWHWFGDCESCQGKGCLHCKHTGAGTLFHPHLNIFIDKGYIKDLAAFLLPIQQFANTYVARLLGQELRARIRRRERYGAEISFIDKTYDEIEHLQAAIRRNKKTVYVVNYSYIVNTPENLPKIINRLKYVLRSTFRVYDAETKDTLHNFRNSIRWGFSKCEKAAPPEPILCKSCLKKGFKHPIKWTRLKQYQNNLKSDYYGKGIYQLIRTGLEPPGASREAYDYVRIEPPKSRTGTRRVISWNKDRIKSEKDSFTFA